MREVPQRLAVGPARWPQDRALVEGLFRDYVAWAGPAAQDHAREVARLPGRYAPPHGCVLIAHAGQDPIGVAAFRRRRTGVCELVRFFVRPAFRGLRIADELLDGLIAAAAAARYRSMVLEVGGSMRIAIDLYEKAGFRPDRRRAPAKPGFLVLRLDLRTFAPAGPAGPADDTAPQAAVG